MDDYVSLEEGQSDIPVRSFEQPKTSRMTALVIRSGLAKDARTAQFLLLLAAVLLVVIAFFLFYFIKPTKPQLPSKAVIDAAMQRGLQSSTQ